MFGLLGGAEYRAQVMARVLLAAAAKDRAAAEWAEVQAKIMTQNAEAMTECWRQVDDAASQ